jgi:hypothetical protein
MRKTGVRFVISVICITIAVHAIGQVTTLAQSSPQIRPVTFTDSLTGDVPVSARPIEGIHYASNPDGWKALWLPFTESGSSICVVVTSDDGRYTANAVYRFTSSNRDTQLSFPTNYAAALQKYGIDRVALLAYYAADCSPKNFQPSYIPIAWHSPADRSQILVFVNGTDTTSVSLYDADTQISTECSLRARTNPVVSNTSVSFDRVCQLTKANNKKRWTGYLNRKHFDEFFAHIPITMRLSQ